MGPLAIAAMLGVGGFGAYKVFGNKTPVLQTVRRITQGGTPIQLVVPVTNEKPVTSVVPTPPVNTSPNLHPTSPAIVTPTGASNFTVQTIQDVQRALNTLAFANPPLTIDGNIGPMTKAAISRFQTAHKIAVTGIADPLTKTALSAALTALAASGLPATINAALVSIASGDAFKATAPLAKTGTSSIANAQHMLNQLGASPILSEDGIIGPITIAAIKAFQLAHGLVADGIAGPATTSALEYQFTPGPAAYTGAMPDQQPTGPGELTPAVENPLS